MSKGRLEAFSDGVIAILITIMVFDLKAPLGTDWDALRPLRDAFLSYVLSFLFLGIYWNNHHHMLQAATRVDGKVLWANLHLLFWLSLVPFVTSWQGGSGFESAPTALYGSVMLGAAIAYTLLQRSITAVHGADSVLAAAVGKDLKGILSLLLYCLAIPLSFIHGGIAAGLYVFVALIWFVPDKRIESLVSNHK